MLQDFATLCGVCGYQLGNYGPEKRVLNCWNWNNMEDTWNTHHSGGGANTGYQAVLCFGMIDRFGMISVPPKGKKTEWGATAGS